MVLSDVSVKRPVFAVVMSLLLIVFGWQSFTQLAVREMPKMEVPIVSISTSYPGANAEVIETRLTRVIEDQVSGIEGIKSVTSSSTDGSSSVSIEFEGDRDMESAANDVRDALSRISRILPEDADFPQISKVNADARAVVWFGLQSDVLDRMQLADYAVRNLVDRFSVVPGVARVQVGGNQRYAMRIWLDRTAMAARGITVADVENALRRENLELPAGRVEGEERDYSVKVARGYQSPKDFEELVVGKGHDGHLIRLVEIAKVEIGSANERTDYRANGKSNIGIGIVKQSVANTLEVAQLAKAEVEKIKETLPPSMTISNSYDSSLFVEEAINQVYETLFIAIGLVIFVIYLFLGSIRAALIPAVTVPVSIIGTFIVLNYADYSINMLTLLALIMAIGMVVDDAIVVLENIYRRVEEGEPALLASYRGARQVAFAVIATTLVLIGVFIPIVLVEGTVARLLSELAVTLAAAVGFSSFVALSLSPMMCSKFLSRKNSKTWLNRQIDRFFKWMNNFYVQLLKINFNNKGGVMVTMIGAFILIAGLGKNLPFEFTPKEDRGGFFMMIRGPEGASYDFMRENVLKVEKVLMEGVENGDLDRVSFNIPGFRSRGDGVNSANGIVLAADWKTREKSTDEIIAWVRSQISDVIDVQAFPVSFGAFRGGGGGGAVQFVIGGNSYEDLARFRDYILMRARENPGLSNVEADLYETRPELRLGVDKTRAADLGISASTVGRTLDVMLGGRKVTTFTDRGEEYDVILRAEPADRANKRDISNLYVRSTTNGQLVPLSNLVNMEQGAGAATLNRYNRVRALTVSASLNEGYTLGEALDYLENIVHGEMPEVVSIDYKGESREYKDSGSAIAFSFVMALLVVFLILAAQFESFIHPFIILMTVPLAIAGALGGLWIMGGSFNLFSQVGIIILIGLSAKNGILIVEFANQLRDEGYSVTDAVIEASSTRLRPILMTGLSTAIGGVPLLIAKGPGHEVLGAIGIVVVSGVIFATLFTLIVIPVFYNILAKYTTSPGEIKRKLEGQAAKRGLVLDPDAHDEEQGAVHVKGPAE